ncbi:outer-membrane lipoprotein carrier protein [Rodentibacter sp. JRC1]|uniref:outer membrane lipoprotein carrier protein LolA n=1 Tax=Rodentibacter TaxID=1960084 RepID=UPI001CFC7ACB|nr:outer membrane lipoprotein carrier protein LolA [Rodentibacter sp. JRC1]GJI56051.1 outer-membrane lipoprotein carrier protein [Rodentibacter sp. JRC1]
MKKYLFLFLLFFSPLSWGFSQAELIQQLQKPQSVQGDFSQQRFLKSLVKPIVATGKFTLVAKKGLLWQMEKPFASQMKVTAQGIFQWNGSNWVTNSSMGQAEQIQLFLGLLSGDISALSSQFEFSLTGSASNWQLLLKPNSLLMKQIFDQITIEGDIVVNSIELKEKQGDRTLIQFENIRLNQPLSALAQSALN